MISPQLQSEPCRRRWIDVFDALNRMPPSVSQSRCRLWRYGENRVRYPCFFDQLTKGPPTTIRTRRSGQIDVLSALNLLVPSDWLYLHWLWLYNTNRL